MKIHFDNVCFGSRTGPNTFAERLARQFMYMGHDVHLDGRLADVSLVFIEPSGAPLAERAFQRLDGIWSRPAEMKFMNERMRAFFDVATGVVFQSEFDQKYICTHWGTPVKHRVIHNGVPKLSLERSDLRLQVQHLRSMYDKMYICSANWTRSKRLKENIQLFRNLQSFDARSVLVVLGDHPDHIASGVDVYYAGSQPHDVCLEFYRAADWMLHLAYFDHCPNTVVEALSQQCPVVCSGTGGTHEVVATYGHLIQEREPFDFTSPCDYEHPPEIDTTMTKPLPHRSTLGSPPNVDIDVVAQRYIDFMETA